MRRASLRVVLVDTADESLGSMDRYGSLVVEALEEAAPEGLEVLRVRLGLPHSVARLAPLWSWAMVHHVHVIARAAGLPRRRRDLWHLLDASHAYLMPWLPRPRVATVHDLIPLLQVGGRFGAARPGRPARVLIER